jgi:ferredoxin, 2Fe-2S
MPTLHVTQPDGRQVNVGAALGQSVMRAAVDAGVQGIIGECGGAAMCGTCHVLVAPDWLDRLPAMRQNEDDLLDCTAAPRQPNSRLGCQLRMTAELDGLRLQLPQSQR